MNPVVIADNYYFQLAENRASLVILAACSGLLSVLVLSLYLVYRKISKKKIRHPEFGTIKCQDMFPPPQYSIGILQQQITDLEDDNNSGAATDALNYGLTHKTYEALRRSARLSTMRNQRSLSMDARNWKLSFRIWFKPEKQVLCVNVLNAKCLTELDQPLISRHPTSSIYVQLFHSSDESKVFCTNLYSNVCTPNIDEQFKFSVPIDKIAEGELRLVLVETEQFDRTRQFQGTFSVDLSTVTLTDGQTVQFVDQDLEPLIKTRRCTGEALLSLRYTRSTERLNVKIINVRSDISSASNDCVKEFQLQTDLILHGKCLNQAHGSASKSIAMAMVCSHNFDVSSTAIDACIVSFSLYTICGGAEDVQQQSCAAETAERQKTLLTQFCFGLSGSGAKQWRKMLSGDGKSVEAWHRFSWSAPIGSSSSSD